MASFFPLLDSLEAEFRGAPASSTAIRDILFLPFSSNLPNCFRAGLSPSFAQTGQGGLYISISGVEHSRHSAWYTWLQTRTATTGRSFVETILWPLHGDFSFNDFEHIKHICCSGEQLLFESKLGPLLGWFSLSNDHLSRRDEATSSENVRNDHPSEEPPWDPPVERSLLSTKERLLASGELCSTGDFREEIRRSEIFQHGFREFWSEEIKQLFEEEGSPALVKYFT